MIDKEFVAIPEQVLNDLKQAIVYSRKVSAGKPNTVSNVFYALQHINLDSYNWIMEYCEFDGKSIIPANYYHLVNRIK